MKLIGSALKFVGQACILIVIVAFLVILPALITGKLP